MPFVRVLTNAQSEGERQREILRELSSLTAKILGKPESYVMVSLSLDEEVMFAGSSEPCAFVELKSLGLSAEACPALSAALCEFLKSSLGVDPARIYIEFAAPERSMFGWDGSTF